MVYVINIYRDVLILFLGCSVRILVDEPTEFSA